MTRLAFLDRRVYHHGTAKGLAAIDKPVLFPVYYR